MRNMIALIICAASVSCSSITGPKGTTYTTEFSTQFVETSVHQGGVLQNCADTYNMTGTVTVIIRKSDGTAIDGVGRVNATHTWLSVAGEGCTRGPDRSTSGDWTADLTGTPANFAFTVQRASGTTFVHTTTYAFAGALANNVVTGTLALTMTGQGITGGTTNSTSAAGASIDVTLR